MFVPFQQKSVQQGKKKSVNYLMGVSELRILVASATFSIGLGAFLFYVLFSVSTMHFLLE